MTDPQFQIVDIGTLEESPLNSRQRYDPKKIRELAESMMGGVGVIEPLVVRPSNNEHLEIIAGSRRRHDDSRRRQARADRNRAGSKI